MRMAPRFIVFFALLLVAHASQGQWITAGPITGGVTDQGFRVSLQTGTSALPFQWEVSTTPDFATTVKTGTDSTRTSLYGSVTLDIQGLEADQKYYYRFIRNGMPDVRTGAVRTFPTPGKAGNYRIAVGSCGYVPNPPLYERIKTFDPAVFIHLGDWNWPPAQFGNTLCLDPAKRAAAFGSRYNDVSMKEFILPFFPVDYVYDDDYSWNDSEGWTYPTFDVTLGGGGAITNLYTNPMPPGIREGAIKGYFDHFPAYPAEDTSAGIHHRFRLGNIEFFMVDTRNSRTPRHAAFVKDANGKYSFTPPPGHTMLGASQRAWLLDGLKNSDADWKIVGSSVIFNKNYGVVLNVGLDIQNLALPIGGNLWSGMVIASQMAYNWAGYPADQLPLLDAAEQLGNVVFLSGDSHSNMIDDGANAGFPELSASGLASNDEGTVNSQINLIAGLLGYPSAENLLWNSGGNGLGPNADNARDGYGTIESFGADSLRLCVHDETGLTLGCATLTNKKMTPTTLPTPSRVTIAPNPTNGIVQISAPDPLKSVEVFDLTGRLSARVIPENNRLNLSHLPPGVYLLRVFTSTGNTTARVVLSPKN